METNNYIRVDELIARYPNLAECRADIIAAYEILVESFSNNGTLLIAGNGGSASDAEHIVGELMKEFKQKRKVYSDQAWALRAINPEMGEMLAANLQGALPAISLAGHPALTTAFMNDSDSVLVFAQQVWGYGRKGDVFLALSTSGNSQNVVYAAVAARAKGLKVIGLTGHSVNELQKYCDVCIHVPETETYKVQELHLPVYHNLCLMLEEYFFS